MRLFVAVVVVGALGCCLGGEEAPPPAPVQAPTPLSQALGDMGVSDALNTPQRAAPNAPAQPTQPAPTPAAAPPTQDTPACAEARAARDLVRADLAQLRMTLGGATAARMEAAGQAMAACSSDPDCLSDGKARLARVEAYDRAKAAHEGETRRLAEAEVGLYDADKRVTAACGAP